MFDLNQDIPLWTSIVLMGGGLLVLSWSANLFIDGASALARAFDVSPLIVGMVIIGFGTSAPELVVSVLSGVSGHASLSLGNAYGSCIFNIAAILGIAAIIRPIVVKPSVPFFAAPLLFGITLISYLIERDCVFQRHNGLLLLGLFAVAMPLYCWFDQKSKKGETASGADAPAVSEQPKGRLRAFGALVLGFCLLVSSSHVLVWGCVDFARDVLGVSDLMIGLTVVAIGTSLPELASAIVSARKGEHEFVLGNIVGSNLFNTLGVVGVAGSLAPIGEASFMRDCANILTRDLPIVMALSAGIFVFGINWRSPRSNGRINRFEGALWVLAFVAYTAVMVCQELVAAHERKDGAHEQDRAGAVCPDGAAGAR